MVIILIIFLLLGFVLVYTGVIDNTLLNSFRERMHAVPVIGKMLKPVENGELSELEREKLKLQEEKKLLEEKWQELNEKLQELNHRQKLLDEKEKALNEKEKEIKVLHDKLNTEVKKIEELTKMYEGVKPSKAAQIFKHLDNELVVKILRNMDAEYAAEIFNNMEPEQAAEITRLMNSSEQSAQNQ